MNNYGFVCGEKIYNFDEFPKKLLFLNPKLALLKDGKIKHIFNDDNQFLYLYPHNIIDYYNAVKQNDVIRIVVKKFTSINYDYTALKVKTFFKNSNKNVFEIEPDENYDFSDWNKFFEKIKNVRLKTVLNIKKQKMLAYLQKYIVDINTLKLTIRSCKDFFKQEKYLKILKRLKNSEQCFIAKIYFSLTDCKSYEKVLKKLKKYGFDYVLFSKELIPLNCQNIKLDCCHQIKLLKLKRKYEDNNFKIKIIKDLSTLYYERFKKQKNNCNICYVQKIVRVLRNKKLYPCSAYQIFNEDVYFADDYDLDKKMLTYSQEHCSDCASLFENDYLFKMIQFNKEELKHEKNLCDINPVGIGTFKYKNNWNKINESILFGQNLIDCNMLYNNGKTLHKMSKIINKNCGKLFLYAKLSYPINDIYDVEKQVDEYLKVLHVQCLDLVSIHSLDIVNINLMDVYKELMRLKDRKKIRYIGISNATQDDVEMLLKNGIELFSFEGVYSVSNKYYEDTKMMQYCEKKDILFIAYQGFVVDKKTYQTVSNISKKYEKTPEQLLLNYYINHKNIIMLVKSSTSSHIQLNNCYGFFVEEEDYNKLDHLNHSKEYDVSFKQEDKNKIYTLSYRIIKEVAQ